MRPDAAQCTVGLDVSTPPLARGNDFEPQTRADRAAERRSLPQLLAQLIAGQQRAPIAAQQNAPPLVSQCLRIYRRHAIPVIQGGQNVPEQIGLFAQTVQCGARQQQALLIVDGVVDVHVRRILRSFRVRAMPSGFLGPYFGKQTAPLAQRICMGTLVPMQMRSGQSAFPNRLDFRCRPARA